MKTGMKSFSTKNYLMIYLYNVKFKREVNELFRFIEKRQFFSSNNFYLFVSHLLNDLPDLYIQVRNIMLDY